VAAIDVETAGAGAVRVDVVGPGAEPAPVTAGVASLAVRDLLRGTRRHGKVMAALPQAIYLEFAGCWVAPSPAEPGQYGSRTGSARR